MHVSRIIFTAITKKTELFCVAKRKSPLFRIYYKPAEHSVPYTVEWNARRIAAEEDAPRAFDKGKSVCAIPLFLHME